MFNKICLFESCMFSLCYKDINFLKKVKKQFSWKFDANKNIKFKMNRPIGINKTIR